MCEIAFGPPFALSPRKENLYAYHNFDMSKHAQAPPGLAGNMGYHVDSSQSYESIRTNAALLQPSTANTPESAICPTRYSEGVPRQSAPFSGLLYDVGSNITSFQDHNTGLSECNADESRNGFGSLMSGNSVYLPYTLGQLK